MKKIILILLLFVSFSVKANTYDTSVNIEWVNTYLNYENNGTNYWGQFRYIYANDEIAYRLDAKKAINTFVYSSTAEFSIDSMISLYAYFGYNYPSHNSLEYYMATQELIWEFQGTQVYFTTESEGKGNIIDLESYKQEILDLINNYDQFPIQNNFKFNLGRKTILTEFNKNNYNLVNNTNNEMYILNEDIIIETKEKGYNKFLLSTNYSNRLINKLLEAPNSQTLLVSGSIENVSKEYNYYVNGGSFKFSLYDSLKVAKTNSGLTTYKGNVFELYKDNILIETIEMDEYGEFEIDNLDMGNYALKHVINSGGYKKKTDAYNFSIKKDINRVEKVISLDPMITTLKIEVNKGNPKVGTKYLIKDSKYDIYNSQNKLVTTLTTNELGKAEINLVYNEYKIIEQENEENIHYLTTNDFDKINFIDIYKEEYNAKLKVYLYESGTTFPIEKGNFTINNKLYTTNIDGEIITDSLSEGEYTLIQELKEGYLDNDDVTVLINKESNFYLDNGEVYIDVIIYNERIPIIDNKKEDIEEKLNNSNLNEDKKTVDLIDEYIDINDSLMKKDLNDNTKNNMEKLPYLHSNDLILINYIGLIISAYYIKKIIY